MNFTQYLPIAMLLYKKHYEFNRLQIKNQALAEQYIISNK
jgi:hypothetical protein